MAVEVMYRKQINSSRTEQSARAVSPAFRALTPDTYEELECLDVSCLPESKSPVAGDKLTVAQRLLQKSEASQRRLEELKLKRSKQEAAKMRDRPFVSRRSKALATNAEERFWRTHWTPERQPPPAPLLEVPSVAETRPPRPTFKPRLAIQPTPSYTSLREKIQAFLLPQQECGETTQKDTMRMTKRDSGYRSTGRLRTEGKREGRAKAGNASFYRSISPANVNVSFTEGCDFDRLRQGK